jgi:hypothetical protein
MYNFGRKESLVATNRTELHCADKICILLWNAIHPKVTTYKSERYSDIKFLEVCSPKRLVWYPQ